VSLVKNANTVPRSTYFDPFFACTVHEKVMINFYRQRKNMKDNAQLEGGARLCHGCRHGLSDEEKKNTSDNPKLHLETDG
jgi:hypothetical protein